MINWKGYTRNPKVRAVSVRMLPGYVTGARQVLTMYSMGMEAVRTIKIGYEKGTKQVPREIIPVSYLFHTQTVSNVPLSFSALGYVMGTLKVLASIKRHPKVKFFT